MVSIDYARQLALSFAEVIEQPHFKKIWFRVSKKIFAILNETHKPILRKPNRQLLVLLTLKPFTQLRVAEANKVIPL
jgi:hypothetical protein